jgi:hypothetical protein
MALADIKASWFLRSSCGLSVPDMRKTREKKQADILSSLKIDARIQYLDLVSLSDHHVGGFQVPMYYSLFVRGFKSFGDLVADHHCFINRQIRDRSGRLIRQIGRDSSFPNHASDGEEASHRQRHQLADSIVEALNKTAGLRQTNTH